MASQVEILMRTAGGPAKAGPGGGSPSADQKAGAKAGGKEGGKEGGGKDTETKKGFKELGGRLKGAGKFFQKNLGLQFGMSSMLKQSQIFTSFIGVIFQLMGALIDVILAPLIPLFFPVIRRIGAAIPYLQKFMENVAGWARAGLNIILGWYNKAKNWVTGKIDEWNQAWKAGPKEFGTFLWNQVWGGLTWVWDKLKNDLGPWLWDQIKGLGDSVWQWLQTTGGRIFGWFAQAYIMLGFVRTGVDKIVAWSTRFGIGILRWLGAKAAQFFVWGLKVIPRLIGVAWKVASFLIKMILPGFGHIIVAIVNGFGRLVGKIPQVLGWVAKSFRGWIDDILLRLMLFRDSLMKWLRGALNLVPTVIKDFVTRLMSSLKRFIAETVKNLLSKLGNLLGKLPLVGGALKKLGGIGKGLFGGVSKLAGGIGKAVGGKGLLKMVGTVAKMSKAIPVLGSVATLGFGAVETYNNFKNHGWKAGLATAGKTIAATTLAATGNTVASMAVDMGGTLAINKFLKKKEGEGAAGGPAISAAGMSATKGATTVVQITTQNGESLFDQSISKKDSEEEYKFDLSNQLQAADQT